MYNLSSQPYSYQESRQSSPAKTKTVYCRTCGLPIEESIFGKNSPLCKDCRKKQRTSIEKGSTCETCGKTFYVDWRNFFRTPPRFCSASCSRKYSSQSAFNSSTLSKTLPCQECGAPVVVNLHSRNAQLCDSCKSRKPKKTRKRSYMYPVESELGNFERSQAYRQKSENLSKLGFDFTQPLDQEFFKLQKLLHTLYVEEELSTLVIKEMYNIPSTLTLPNFLRLCNIPVRTLKESSLLGVKTGRIKIEKGLDSMHFRYFYKHGYYKDFKGKEHYLRSSLEFALAEKLDFLNLEYETESEIDYLSSEDGLVHKGYPDFYIPSLNLYIEMKGSFIYDGQNLSDRSKAITSMGQKFLVLTYGTKQGAHFLHKIDNFNNLSEETIQQFLL